MSLMADSPVHSSSSDDFAALLDAELGSSSSKSSSDNEKEDDEEGNSEEASNEEGNDEVSDLETERIKRRKVDRAEIIEQVEVASASHEPLEQDYEVSLKQALCSHPGSFGNMCIICGIRMEEESGVTFGYIHKGLRLGNDEVTRLRDSDMKSLLHHKKLILVLDLDHTLLNSTILSHITSEEEYLKNQVDSLQDVAKGSLFMLDYMRMMTKLRPFVRPFLKEASEMFEMYIYTMGDRPYAAEMAKLLDPEREYFNGRVISRDDGTQRHQKSLDIVLGQESAVLILDDTESAWTKHKDNLILMERYHFFSSSCQQFGYNCKSLSELKSDESESDGSLANVLKALKKIHHNYFEDLGDNDANKDVRLVMKLVRKEVLQGCKMVFSRVFPTNFNAGDHHLWKVAEQLGATCVPELDQSVTHVVSMDAGTEKSRWAVKQKKFLVNPRWIEAANFLWRKLPEENFPVNTTTEQ